jgi:uncharacterized membrane protein YdjX (TVP38/TMEM64 family)
MTVSRCQEVCHTLFRSPSWARPAAAVVVLAVASAILLTQGVPTVDDLRGFIEISGWAAPLLFVLGYAVATVFLVPGVALTVLGGVLFGAAIGTLLVVVGATLGAVAAFAIARHLGRERVQRVVRGRLRRADEWIGRKGFGTILALRLAPLVPFNALNYAAGLSSVSPRAYAAATAVGIVPGSFAYASLGGALDDPWSPGFIAALALVLAVGALGGLIQRRLHGSAAPS